MSLRIYFGASGAGKSYRAYSDIIIESLEHRDTEYLVIVPDQFTMQTQKEIVMRHPNQGILNIDVLSFGRLAHRILSEVGCEEKELIDDTGKCLLLRKMISEMGDELPILGRQLKKPGYVQEVKSIFSEFMQYAVEPCDVAEMSENASGRIMLKRKLSELSTLYARFLTCLRETYATKEELPLILKKCIPQSEIIKKSVVLFDGFTGFTPVQNQVIEELLCYAKEVRITLCMDERVSPYRVGREEDLFFLSQKTAVNAMKLAERNSCMVKEPIVLDENPVYRYRDNDELAHLERNLFRYPLCPYEHKTEKIRVQKMFSPKEEVRWISYEVLRLIKEEGYSFRDFAIVTGDLERYRDEVRLQFSKYNIPFFMDTTRSLSLNPFVEFLRGAIRVVMNDFAFTDVFHFLRSGIGILKNSEIDALENYVIAMGIRGRSGWSCEFFRYSREILGQEDKLQELNRSRERVWNAFEKLQAQDNDETIMVKQRIMELYEFTVAAKVEEKLKVYREKFLSENDLAKAKEYEQIYKVVMELLSQFYELLGDEKMSWKNFLDILEAGFAEVRVGTLPQTVDRLIVGDIERTRLGSIKVLFFMGINDGIIPKNCEKGGILSEMDREFLLMQGRELTPTARQSNFIQRLYIYMNMTKPTQRLYLSYSAVDADGKAIRPAYLVYDIKNLFPHVTEEIWEGKEYADLIHATEDGLEQMAELMRMYTQETLDERNTELLFSLYSQLLMRKEIATIAEAVEESAFIHYHVERIPTELVSRLYGEIVASSISNMERFAACEYAYYLQYGLRLRQAETYEFEQMDMGNVYHKVLEEFGQFLAQQQQEWGSFKENEVNDEINHIVEQVALDYGGSVLFSDARNSYRTQQLKRIIKRTIFTLQSQLLHGDFSPYRYEVPFEKNMLISLNNEEYKVRFRGRIDRMDTCEDNDRVFIKVLDFKSGNHDFDLTKLFYGLQLQLPIYLKYATDVMNSVTSKNAVPSAMLYYHIDDPVIDFSGEAVTEEIITQKVLETLVPKGVVCNDETIVNHLDSDFSGKSISIPVSKDKSGGIKSGKNCVNPKLLKTVIDYSVSKTEQLCREMLDGSISINPYELKQENACTYCAFRRNCGFDKRIQGFTMRELSDDNPFKNECMDENDCGEEN